MQEDRPTIEFRLDSHSGVPVYMQIVQQVQRALRLGFLIIGDQLPTVREVVSKLPINPNTVFKAYRELESEGLVETRPGLGTFIVRTLADDTLARHDALRLELIDWIQECRTAGLNDESIEALFLFALQEMKQEVPK